MKSLFFAFVVFVFLLSACSSSPTPTVSSVAMDGTENLDSTLESGISSSEVKEDIKSPAIEASILPTESITPTIIPTSTPVQEKDRWNWVFSPDSGDIQVVNQLGDVRSIGKLDLNDVYNYRLLQYNDHQALFFTLLNGKPVIKMFDLDGIQDVGLPSSFSYDEYLFLVSIQKAGASDNYGYFIFATESSYETVSSSYPEKGPLYQIDLNLLSIKLIDSNVFQDNSMDFRYYFFQSEDGQKLRYFKMQDSALLINELDFINGSVRPIAQSTGSPDFVSASKFGESFFLPRTDLYITATGLSKSFTNSQSVVRLLRGGEIILVPSNCSGSCELSVVEPMSGAIMGNYTLPWSTQSFLRIGTQILSDGSLLWIGTPKIYLQDKPSNTDLDSLLDDYDYPVFRLNQDGSSQVIGVFRPRDYTFEYRYPISQDERYILMKSLNSSTFFIYDSEKNQEILTLPSKNGWDFDFGYAFFHPEGILIDFSISNLQKEYAQLFALLRSGTQESVNWENSEDYINFCPDIFEDGTISCWVQRQNLNHDLVRFRPTTQNFNYLIENVVVLEWIY